MTRDKLRKRIRQLQKACDKIGRKLADEKWPCSIDEHISRMVCGDVETLEDRCVEWLDLLQLLDEANVSDKATLTTGMLTPAEPYPPGRGPSDYG